MTLGEKIKQLRKSKGLTQSELANGKITRNMLSAIESDKAYPSYETLLYIADGLGIGASYLISEDDDLFFYEKKARIKDILMLFSGRDYINCLGTIKRINGTDDELEYISAVCCFELGKAAVLSGSLKTAHSFLDACEVHSCNTVYDVSKIKSGLAIYTALVKNIQSPLLELDTQYFESLINKDFEFEFYKYLTGEFTYAFSNPVYKMHIEAKGLMKERRYSEALTRLHTIEEEKTPKSYNAYVIFSLYSDIENCYKQLADFENAYRYASKRLSIIEGFKQ